MMLNYFSNTNLLTLPIKRAAYSDRTSYLMCEMSRLAYFKFEGGSNIGQMLKLVENIRNVIPKNTDNTDLSTLEALIKSSNAPDSPVQGENILRSILSTCGFNLVAAYSSSKGAQAFLCTSKEEKKLNMAILAFRGTEKNLKDIKADVKVELCPAPPVKKGGKEILIHSGYYDQFESVKDRITKDLNSRDLEGFQLFITGHSLGGALAITAVKFLASDITGACYTFGSPPVGTKEFDRDIKTPIYRIVNHVDIVPRLPNPILAWVIRGFAFLVGSFLSPVIGFSSTIKESGWHKNLKKSFWMHKNIGNRDMEASL